MRTAGSLVSPIHISRIHRLRPTEAPASPRMTGWTGPWSSSSPMATRFIGLIPVTPPRPKTRLGTNGRAHPMHLDSSPASWSQPAPRRITPMTGLGNLSTVNQLGVSSETQRGRSFVYDSLSRLTSEAPRKRHTSYGYDANGNVQRRTMRAGNGTYYSTMC